MSSISLKDKYGRIIAVVDDGFEAVETGETATIADKPAKRVAVKTPESVETGYVEEEVLEELTEETISIPANFNGLEAEMIPTRIRDQLFEITDVVEDDEYVEVTALHIFYRQRMNSTTWEPSKTTKYSGAAACRNIMNNVMFDLGFNVASDSTDLILGDELDYARKNIVEAFLDPASGICEKYKLSLIRDNDVFYCLKNVGYDRGFVIQDGKNMLGVERTESIENVVTRIAPLGRDSEGNFVWMNYNGNYVDSVHINDYACPRLEILYTDLQVGKDDVTAENIHQKLYEKANERFEKDEVDLPEVTMTIRFVSLGDTEEYAQYRDLDRVYLYDILHIKDSARGYNYSAQVIGVEHNVLTGRLESVTIGTPKKWDGVRTVATWRIPEISGTVIRQNTIRSGSFQTGAIHSADIANGSITGSHFGSGGQSAVKQLALEQLIVENTSPDGLLYTRFAVVEGQISSSISNLESGLHSEIIQTASQISMAVENSISNLQSSLQITADNIRSEVSASESTLYSRINQTASGIRADMVAADSGLYSYIDATASYLRTHFVNGANKVFIQDGDPTGDPTYTPKVGDVWIESTHQGTWDGAEGFDWEHDADYDWSQVQGAKLWGWQNDKWELVSDQQQVVTMGDVIETAERYVNTKVKLVVNDEGNISVYMAKLEQEAGMIRSEVNDYVQSLGSSIRQTAGELRSEVHAAESYIYSVVEQSASGILVKVNESSNVYTGTTAPTGTADRPIKENDVWIDTNFQRNWSDVDDLISWADDEDYDWSETQGSKVNVYDGTGWREVLDERPLMTHTDYEYLADGFHQISRSIETVSNGLNAYIGRLEVTSKQMKLDYTDRYRQLSSNITATASQLRTEFNDTANGLSSSITQTASQIRSELNDRANGLSSSITQTASQIRSEVTDTKNSLQSSITQQANRISLVVEGTGANAKIKAASIVASINSSGSSVVISANKINLNGYVTTSMLESAFQSVGQIAVDQLTIDDYFTCLGRNVSWQSKTIRHVQVSAQRSFMYGSTSGASGTITGSLVLSTSDSTIYYLGR